MLTQTLLGWVRMQVTRSNLRKNFFILQGPHFWSNLPQTWFEYFLGDILVKFDHVLGWVGTKSRSHCQVLETSCLHSRATFVAQSSSNLLRIFVLIIFRSSSIMGWVGSKSRSPGQILEKYCLLYRGHIFYPIFLKLAQNVCLANSLVKFNHALGVR